MPNNTILDEANQISEAEWNRMLTEYQRQSRAVQERAERYRNSMMYQQYSTIIASTAGSSGYNQVYYGAGGAGGYGEWRTSESKPKAKKESKIPWL